MFYSSNSLKYLDLRNFNGSSVTNINYMFDSCQSLKYLNLKYFKILNDELEFNSIEGVPETVKYCIEDTNTKNKLIGDKSSDCSDFCFQENIKFNLELDKCICNENYKSQYNNTCNKNCPNSKYSTFQNNEYICIDTIPDNYYYDNNYNAHKECYYKCKRCNKGGNDTFNNCNECKEEYTFLNDSSVPQKNCYNSCDHYYYFNELNEYICTESNECLSQLNKIIEQKKKCIDECKKDNEYKYEYNNICLKECPLNTKTYENEKLCLDECYPEQFEYNNSCYNNCPPGTYRLFNNRNICIETIPENYYLDNNDDIYKECYYKCKKCSKGGNDNFNNCDECIDGYDYYFASKKLF